MRHRAELINANSKDRIKEIILFGIYREAQEEVKKMNDKLNKKPNTNGKYWTITHINF